MRAVVGVVVGSVVVSVLLAGCFDFDFVEPAVSPEGGADGGGDAPAGDSGACVADLRYCGGDRVRGPVDTVFRCLPDGGATLVAKCASGCLRDAGAGEPGRCAIPTAPCQVNGRYCGGDKLDGDPAVLYRCGSGGTAIEIERCARGCQVAPAGSDDACVK